MKSLTGEGTFMKYEEGGIDELWDTDYSTCYGNNTDNPHPLEMQ